MSANGAPRGLTNKGNTLTLSPDADSLHVNVGSQRSTHPSPLQHEYDDDKKNETTGRRGGEQQYQQTIALPDELSTDDEEEDEKQREKLQEIDDKETQLPPPATPPLPPPTQFIIDPAGDLTHDQTTVDIVTVACPGGHPLRSWNRDGLLGRYFGAPSMRDAEARNQQAAGPSENNKRTGGAGNNGSGSSGSSSSSQKQQSGPSWVRQGIRREADMARILLYDHPADMVADKDVTLGKLADRLLEELQALRGREGGDAAAGGGGGGERRPVVFVAHSLGGLVVKMALVKASRDGRYEGILKECYGVAFFGTPHQGSSYFAMSSLAGSIQNLLQLSHQLPPSITDGLRVGNSLLLHVDEDFKTISNDLRIWTFYETIDSRLSGGSNCTGGAVAAAATVKGTTGGDAVYFTAPLASIKSAILGMRQERIFPLQSDHANVASFGRHNVETLRLFLRQLAAQVRRADASAKEAASSSRWALDLEQKVNVEVHGFFADPPVPGALMGAAGEPAAIRAWSTRLPLGQFLSKGPEECLSERLNEVEGAPEESRFLRKRGRTARTSMAEEGDDDDDDPPKTLLNQNALGIRNQQIAQQNPPNSPILKPVIPEMRTPGLRRESAPALSHALRSPRLSPISSPPSRYSTPMRRPSPLIRADFDQDLAVDQLSPVIRPIMGRSVSRSISLGSDVSRIEYRDFPPFSQRSRSTFDARREGREERYEERGEEDDMDALPKLPEAVVAIRKAAKNGQQRVSETVIVDDVAVAFAKPEVSERKFLWIHVPFNNPTWVKNVLETLQTAYKKDFSPLYNHNFWATKHTRGRHSQHYAYFAKPGCYYTAPRALSRTHSLSSPSLSPHSRDANSYTCVFLPYLHFDSYKRLIRRRELIQQRLAHGRAHPVPDSVAKSESTELQVLWEFLGHDPPINSRRTLDQYGYPSLRDTRSRDDDQMLYKLTKDRLFLPGQQRDLYTQWSTSQTGSDRSATGSWRKRNVRRDVESDDDADGMDNVLNGNVLMVDQLWLWSIGSHTLLTFFPKRESDPIEGPLYQQADLRDSIFNEVNVDLTRQCDNSLDLAALAVLHAVSVLLDRSSHPDLEIFRIFEEAISVLNEKLTSSLKAFRTEGFRDKAQDYEPVENKEHSIRARHKEEGRRAEEENRDNTSALLELRDLEDELLVLLHLFERQSKVVSSMHAAYTRPEMREHTGNGRVFLDEALKRLGDYAHQAEEMIARVRATRDDYDKLLQMVQRQAQVDEVRLSRLHADLASSQSRSVMIFTVFTVIFLPLSFFTSLFGMNTREWAGGDNLRLATIGAVALPSSAVLILTALVTAWSTTVRRALQWVGGLCGRVRRWVFVVTWRPVVRWWVRRRRMQRRQAGKGRGEGWGGRGSRGGGRGESADGSGGGAGGKEFGLGREASDFWERHRLERERGYRIPEVNKGGAGGAEGSGKKKAKKKDSRGQ